MIGKNQKPFDLVVVGAGPAGLMAAHTAACAGARVLVLERMDRPGLKLLASGGGRCNLTNNLALERFAARYGAAHRFVKSALSAFPPRRLRDWFSRQGMDTRADDEGLIYPCDNDARSIHHALVRAVNEAGAEWLLHTTITRIKKKEGGFELEGPAGAIPTHRLLLATGGRGYAKLGGHASGHALAQTLGHTLHEPVPALVPLTTKEAWTRQMPGVSLEDVELSLDRQISTGPLLFTHRGLSGPAVLNLSGTVAQALQKGAPVNLSLRLIRSLSPDQWSERFQNWHRLEGTRRITTLLKTCLPEAMMRVTIDYAGMNPELPAGQLKQDTRRRLIEALTRLPVTATGTEGFEQAMVTRGGVPLNEVRAKSLESRICPGLFFAGEILDVDGPCGGFNLQWAFSSGYLAGRSTTGENPA